MDTAFPSPEEQGYILNWEFADFIIYIAILKQSFSSTVISKVTRVFELRSSSENLTSGVELDPLLKLPQSAAFIPFRHVAASTPGAGTASFGPPGP